jgi:hypothetical protein
VAEVNLVGWEGVQKIRMSSLKRSLGFNGYEAAAELKEPYKFNLLTTLKEK